MTTTSPCTSGDTWSVFGALLVLTLVTVGVSYLHLPETPAVAIGLTHRDRQGVARRDVLHAPEGREADGLLAARA